MNNLDNFLNHLEDDLSWRKQELTMLILSHSEVNAFILNKSLILMIYSHWEGYIKNSCKQYLLYVSQKKIQTNLLTSNFKAIMVKGHVNEVINSNNTLTLGNEISLLDKINGNMYKKFNIPKSILSEKDKTFINTHDNLNYKTLKSFCEIVGIGSVDFIESKEKYINETLLAQRNAISHGNKIDPESVAFNLNRDNILRLRDLIFLIMDHIKDELSIFAENEFYLQKNEDEKLIHINLVSNNITKKLNNSFPPEE
ncbi:MAE_28990/MAE_18760 family HEPN-like nuclease [Photobacterium toruni]|uniref:MAE_28990/MAE_18760 family HEPN-like nuclease n=1 Tax=Photobacterium toruni TaxID=1935446 RepID=UPI002E185326|nr:MAE_28990/MAE_18760 family HEPN-like nuclease [Photobacterium toruni]